MDKFSVVLREADSAGMDFMAFKVVDDATLSKLKQELEDLALAQAAAVAVGLVQPEARHVLRADALRKQVRHNVFAHSRAHFFKHFAPLLHE